MENNEEQHGNKGSRLRLRTDRDFIANSFKMFRICFAFGMSGWTEALNGPTFPDLRLIIQKDLDTSSWLFTVTSLGILVGSAVASLLMRLKQRNVVFAVTILCYATGVALVPWCPHFYLMLTVKFFVGIFASILSTGYITEVAAMLKETQSAGFYMQILHFCFSLGGMISPLVARPFLAPEVADVHTSLNCNFSLENLKDTKFSGEKTEYNFDNYWLDSLNDSDVIRNKTFVDCDKQFAETNVMYAYLITAGMLVFAAMMFIAASIFDTKNKEQPRLVVKNGLHNSKLEETPFYQRVVFICLMSFLLFLYVGSEVTFAGFLSSFTSLQLNWSKYKGALATSVFWIAFGLARFAGIWLAKVLKTVTFLFTFPSLLVISHSLLLVVTSVNNDLVVMVCVGMIGISMSVIFASVITWTTENVTMVTGRISALFIASCSIGIMIFPLLFGYMMDLFSPSWFNYLLIGIAVLWLVIFSITFILSKRLLTAHTVEIEIVEKQPFQTDE